jgi:hypothetical protein
MILFGWIAREPSNKGRYEGGDESAMDDKIVTMERGPCHAFPPCRGSDPGGTHNTAKMATSSGPCMVSSWGIFDSDSVPSS